MTIVIHRFNLNGVTAKFLVVVYGADRGRRGACWQYNYRSRRRPRQPDLPYTEVLDG